MRSILSLFTTLVALAGVASAGHGSGFQAKRHGSRSLPSRQEDAVSTLDKRQQFSGGFTFFDDGLGACGIWSNPGDFIVALNVEQFNGGQYCFQTVTITVNGKSTQAQIVDECMGCPYGYLDFSRGLFDFFADESVGEVYGSWSFGGGYVAPTTTDWVAPTTTTTWTPPTTTTTWTTTTTVATTTTTTTSAAASTSPPAGAVAVSVSGNWADLQLVMLAFGDMVTEGKA